VIEAKPDAGGTGAGKLNKLCAQGFDLVAFVTCDLQPAKTAFLSTPSQNSQLYWLLLLAYTPANQTTQAALGA